MGYNRQNFKNGQVLTADCLNRMEDALCELMEELDNPNGEPGVTVEPADDDIPKVFFGGDLQQTKDEKIVPFRYISRTYDFSGFAEIKAQGSSSMGYAKKNQTVKLFKDANCEEKLKVDFKGWGKQNKHVYKANWIDLTHARNIVSARLWADVVKTRANYEDLPDLYKTSPNQGAVDGLPVKVYAAGVYQGRYTLNIPKDAWMANMDDDLDNHCILCGESNAYASSLFRARANIVGTAWSDEVHDVVPASIKTRWNEVIDFVMNSTDVEFKANLSEYFYVDSLIDYHLFGLVSCGLDAYGKNQLYMTYDGQKWIAAMYDMDSTWGLWWNGGSFVPTDYDRSEYQDFKDGEGNLLYIRLEQLFWKELQTRWEELKNGALSVANIINRFERFVDIAPAELVKEDYATTTGGGSFTGIPSKETNNIQQIRAFAVARWAWVGEYLKRLVYIPCTGISLSAGALTFTEEGTQTLSAIVTPDDCTDVITWESNNNSVAIVHDGVVTAVANGSAIITAKCGKYSANCTVSVSGIFEPVPCTGITLSASELTFAGSGQQTLIATVTPTDTTDSIVWHSSNEAKATVEGGIVTAISNGSAIITATCGEFNAECVVTISGIESAPLFTLENGTHTFADSSVLEITNGNHVKLTKTAAQAHVNIARVSQNGDALSNLSREHETIYELPAKVTRIVVDFSNSCTATGNSSVTCAVPNVPTGTYDLASGVAIGTDIDKATPGNVGYLNWSAIGFWTNAGAGVIEFDLKLYAGEERII